MEKNDLLEKFMIKNSNRTPLFLALGAALGVLLLLLTQPWRETASPNNIRPLRVAIAPYQDLAMLVNAPKLGIDKKHELRVELVNLAWEDILPAVGSEGTSVDVGFGSLVEYITKYKRINSGSDDPIIFIQPLYVYKGGGFVAFPHKVPPFDVAQLSDPEQIKRLTRYRIGAQKESLYDMMLYAIASRGGIRPAELKVYDSPMNDAVLALESGSLELAAAGLTQINEAKKRGAELAISMEDAGFADITGFICRRSTLDKRRKELESLVKVWFECVDYVYDDIDKNSSNSMDYLRKNSAANYSLEEYKAALSQEFLPRSAEELNQTMINAGSKYDIHRIASSINSYLLERRVIETKVEIPVPLTNQKSPQ